MGFPSMLLLGCLAAWTSAAQSRADVDDRVWRMPVDADQRVSVWVYFRDKGLSTPAELEAGLAAAESALTPRAVQRRRLRRTAPGLVDVRDLPVCPRYVDQVLAAGPNLRVCSRWLNAVSVRATHQQIRAVAQFPFVAAITPVRAGGRADAVPIWPSAPAGSPPGLTSRPPGGADPLPAGAFYGSSHDQLAQIGVIDMHAAGFTGSGIVIGVLDTGFTRTHEVFNNPERPIQVLAEWDFLDGDASTAAEPGDPPSQHHHGTIVLATIAAYRPGTLVGGAYEASFILAKTEDVTDEYPAEEDYYVAGLEFIEMRGADVATSSLGYSDWYDYFDMDGQTAVTTRAVNVATANGLVCCTAAGNRGQDMDFPTLIAPGDALQVITCGAVNVAGALADFSSGGPTADGRVKPEVLARGVATQSISPVDPASYQSANGTSLSTPLVASAAALLVQAHPNWTVDQIRTALFETASDYVLTGTTDPNGLRGYGIVNVHAAAQMAFCGTSTVNLPDGDGDSVPDACDNCPVTANPGQADCDDDGAGDLCAIADGLVDDCDANGIPDSCDRAAYGDANGNGVVELDDVVCLLDGYGGSFPCPGVTLVDLDIAPCGGDQWIDLLDIIAILDAFSGHPQCPLPCR